MISSQRQQYILRRLRTHGTVRCVDLARDLDVSPMTVRRDIAVLEDKGLLKRVHGGAVTTGTLMSEPMFAATNHKEIGDKEAIAKAAVDLVSPGDVIGIGGGSTTYLFAQYLFESDKSAGITVLTNSLPVADLVEGLDNRDVEVIVTGGVTTRFKSLIGPIANKVIGSLRVNKLFLGAHAVSVPRGFLTPNSLESSTNAAFIAIADHTIMLADHTKWSNTSLSLFATFDDVETIITDSALPEASLEETKKLVPNVIVS